MTLEELKRIAASVGERRGWDFSRMQADRDLVPWEYANLKRELARKSRGNRDLYTPGKAEFIESVLRMAARTSGATQR